MHMTLPKIVELVTKKEIPANRKYLIFEVSEPNVRLMLGRPRFMVFISLVEHPCDISHDHV